MMFSFYSCCLHFPFAFTVQYLHLIHLNHHRQHHHRHHHHHAVTSTISNHIANSDCVLISRIIKQLHAHYLSPFHIPLCFSWSFLLCLHGGTQKSFYFRHHKSLWQKGRLVRPNWYDWNNSEAKDVKTEDTRHRTEWTLKLISFFA